MTIAAAVRRLDRIQLAPNPLRRNDGVSARHALIDPSSRWPTLAIFGVIAVGVPVF